MKYIKKFIRQSYGLDYLNKIAEITKGNGRQSEFYQWQVDNAKLVDISESPNYVIKGNPKQKQCYRNAFKVASENYNKDILYVEGIIMMHGIPIEHAWNKIGDVYFDVTSEISGIKHKEYISIIELNSDKIWKYADETGFYGPFMSSCFLDTHINENTKSEKFNLWFGDSKIVNKDGTPRIVYHGTVENFRRFSMKKSVMGGITWFSTDREKIEKGESGAAGSKFIKNIYVSLKNPAYWDEYEKYTLGQLQDMKYDGVILDNGDGSYDGFVFHTNQIRIAR